MKYLLILISSMLIGVCYAQQGFHGTIEPIPDKIAKQIVGHSWHQGCPLPLNSMRYLTITYWGFDHKAHEGHLIILNELSGETLQIFQELYKIKFPIEKMVLPEAYSSKMNDWLDIDWKSSENNDTVGFFCRDDDQNPGHLSPHRMDINPVYNPSMVANNKVEPESGKKYLNRQLQHEGKIDENVVAIFAKYGWKWGGYWSKDKVDYQHFQKDMDEHYLSPTLILFRK